MSYRPATVQGAKYRKDWESTSRLGQAAVPVGGGGAWPGFETTRRAKLAARTARGRAAAHGHNQQPGPQQAVRNTSATTTNVSRETSAQPPAPLPRMARKVAHLTYTVLCNFMQRMACLDSAFDQRRHPGLVRAHARAGKPPRPLVRRLRGTRPQSARIGNPRALFRGVAPLVEG